MLYWIEKINSAVNGFLWGVPAMICIMGVGLWLSFGTGFVQLRRFGYAIRHTFGRLFERKEAADGSMTPFQAVCTALAGTVGTGNIAGVAGAIALGGPGAVFWMWMSALLGMCTKFSEVVLAVHYRERNAAGDWVGGPMYYIKNGLGRKWRFLAVLYALFGVFAVFGTGNATQVNAIITAIDKALVDLYLIFPEDAHKYDLIFSIVIALGVALVLLGGIRRIGRFTERLVPFMALLYIILSLGVVCFRIKQVPAVFAAIFEGAFRPRAFTGGVVGSFFIAMRRGVSRGIFSNEAGLGTGTIAHATADTSSPVRQGLYGIFEVFADTIVICTLTALVILLSGVTVPYGGSAGAELTIGGFSACYGGWITAYTAIALICFAFSTIISWGLYGARFMEYLFGTKVIRPFMVVYSLVAILGATVDLGLLWDISDTFNGLMVIPNLIAVALLSGMVFRLTKEYFKGDKLE